MLEYPIRPGLIFLPRPRFPYELNEIIAEKAIPADRGSWAIDIAGPEPLGFEVADYRDLFPPVPENAGWA